MVRAGKAPAGGGNPTPCVRTRAMRRRQSEEWLLNLVSSAELTPLFQALDLESLTALACAAKAWQRAIDDFRATEPRMGPMNWWHAITPLDAAQFVKRVLPRYVNLQHLNIDHLRYDVKQEVRGMLSMWPGLRSLNMDSCRSDGKMDHNVGLCSGLPSLRELTLSDSYELTDAHLESLLGSPQLRRLSIGQTRQPAPLVHALTEVASGPGCPLLEQIYLHCCIHLGHALLSVAKCCPGLRVLDLTGCIRVTDASIVAIGQACPRLEVLRLLGCRLVGAGGVTAVATGCKHLKELDLRECGQVTSDCIVAVARGCPQLERLDLYELEFVDDSAFCALAQGCRRLREIDALGTQISAPGLTALLGIPLLTHLAVESSSRLSQEAIEAARERHPKVACMRFSHINLTVRTQDGNEIYFKCKRTTPLQKLMHAYCNRQGVTMGSVRFLFDGNRVNETQTPGQLDMEDGDAIDVMVQQQGFLPWSSLAVAKPTTAAERLLSDAAGAPSLSHSEVAALVAAATGPHAKPGRAEVVESRPLLTAAQCAVLVDHAERAFAASAGDSDGESGSSWKLELSCEELAALAGPAAVAALCALGNDALRQSRPTGGGVPHRPRLIVRRRAARAAERVVFHRDYRRVVVHTPLNDDHEGGRLLLALGGREVRLATPTPGVATAIDNAVVHGVSTVTAGTRYVLLAAFGND